MWATIFIHDHITKGSAVLVTGWGYHIFPNTWSSWSPIREHVIPWGGGGSSLLMLVSFYRKPDGNTGRHLVEDHDLEDGCGSLNGWRVDGRQKSGMWPALQICFLSLYLSLLLPCPANGGQFKSTLPRLLSHQVDIEWVSTCSIFLSHGGNFHTDITEKSLGCVQSRTRGRGLYTQVSVNSQVHGTQRQPK